LINDEDICFFFTKKRKEKLVVGQACCYDHRYMI